MCEHRDRVTFVKKIRRSKYEVLVCRHCLLMSMGGAEDYWLSPAEPGLLERLKFSHERRRGEAAGMASSFRQRRR